MNIEVVQDLHTTPRKPPVMEDRRQLAANEPSMILLPEVPMTPRLLTQELVLPLSVVRW
jgi:hypothetical protein